MNACISACEEAGEWQHVLELLLLAQEPEPLSRGDRNAMMDGENVECQEIFELIHVEHLIMKHNIEHNKPQLTDHLAMVCCTHTFGSTFGDGL